MIFKNEGGPNIKHIATTVPETSETTARFDAKKFISKEDWTHIRDLLEEISDGLPHPYSFFVPAWVRIIDPSLTVPDKIRSMLLDEFQKRYARYIEGKTPRKARDAMNMVGALKLCSDHIPYRQQKSNSVDIELVCESFGKGLDQKASDTMELALCAIANSELMRHIRAEDIEDRRALITADSIPGMLDWMPVRLRQFVNQAFMRVITPDPPYTFSESEREDIEALFQKYRQSNQWAEFVQLAAVLTLLSADTVRITDSGLEITPHKTILLPDAPTPVPQRKHI